MEAQTDILWVLCIVPKYLFCLLTPLVSLDLSPIGITPFISHYYFKGLANRTVGLNFFPRKNTHATFSDL